MRTWSLPSRERGLKSVSQPIPDIGKPSLPSRERGLKCSQHARMLYSLLVAPFTGAWIEMGCKATRRPMWPVAPFTGAWIEILAVCLEPLIVGSLPSRERGLK